MCDCLKQGIHKVKERLSSITPKENETNINSITFFVNSKTKSPEEYSINNEKKYGMRKNDSMRKFFRLHDERSINFKSQTLAKDFLKPLANKKGSPTKNGYLNSHKLIKVEETNGEFKMKLKNPKIISIK